MYTDNLFNKIESYLPKDEVSKITNAFEFAKDAHKGQKRKSGHDFIVHPVEVATHLARLELDPKVIISGLLHDVIEDTKINSKDIQNEFGKEITLVNFFATWCKPCLNEHKYIKLFSDEKKLRVIHTDELWYKDKVLLNQKNKHKKSGGDIFEKCVKCEGTSGSNLRCKFFILNISNLLKSL